MKTFLDKNKWRVCHTEPHKSNSSISILGRRKRISEKDQRQRRNQEQRAGYLETKTDCSKIKWT